MVIAIILLVVLGLCLGSFVNALVWRLHAQEELQQAKSSKLKEQRLQQLSIVHGRSMCSHCGHQLAAIDLIPVVSWLTLRGKCRYCHHKIEDSPLVELLTAGLFVFSYLFWPLPLHGFGLFEFVPWLLFVTGFMALAIYDLRWFLLPTRLLRPLIGLAVVQVLGLILLYHGGLRTFAGAVFGVLVTSGVFYVLFMVSQGKWIGGGDVRLGLLLGLLVGGPAQSFLLIFFASLLGTIVSLPLLLSRKLQRSSHVPFGPFLLVGVIITRLFGIAIIGWYKHHLLGT